MEADTMNGGLVKPAFKWLVRVVLLVVTLPLALTAMFGHWKLMFQCWAQALALLPGLLGDYLRVAFYRWTLESCALDSCIQFGTFFAHPRARVGRNVYIGCYCILGTVCIGDRTQIASGVQILSGSRQHPRSATGMLLTAAVDRFETVEIGEDCWIGAAAVIMAPIGARSTIGAGSVVVRPIPADCVAVGIPARVIGGTNGAGTSPLSGVVYSGAD